MSEKEKAGFWSRTWVKWTTAVVVVIALAALSVVIWRKPIANAIAHKKAKELHDLAVAAGYKVPPVKDLAELYGVDGGATAATANSDLARAMLSANINGSGEVNQRPGQIDRRLLTFEYLVLKVYKPEEAAKYLNFLDSINSQKLIGQ